MAAHQALQAFAGMLYMLTMAILGCRLLYLAWRSRARPELYLGGSLIVGGVLGACLEAAGLAGARDLEPQVVAGLLLAGKCCGVLGVLCQALFVRSVFRPGVAWAGALTAGLVTWQIGCILGLAASGTFSTGVQPPFWIVIEFIGRVATPAWLVFEGARYYGMMKKRLALGLADPVVTDRFRLWAMGGLCGMVILTTSLPPSFVDPDRHEALLAVDMLIFAAAGVASCIYYGLTFFPPAAYRRRVERRAGAAA